MFNLADVKNFDLKRLDPTKLDLTRFDIRKLDIRKLEVPTFDSDRPAGAEPPMFELPAEANQAVDLARDAAYAGVGAVVVTVQKADELRRQLSDRVAARTRKLLDTVD